MDTLYSQITGSKPSKDAQRNVDEMLDRQRFNEYVKSREEPGLVDNSWMFMPGGLLGKTSKQPELTIDSLTPAMTARVLDGAKRYPNLDPEYAIQLQIRNLANSVGKNYEIPKRYLPGGTLGSLLGDAAYKIAGRLSDPRTVGLMSGGQAGGKAFDDYFGIGLEK